MDLMPLMKLMAEQGASDLVIKVGSPPILRVNGELRRHPAEPLTMDDTRRAVMGILSRDQLERFKRDLELDFALGVPEVGRFRINIFMQRNSPGLVLRLIPASIPTLEQLNLPPVGRELAMRPRGLVLVTGPAGCGKSTTQAALIDHRNAHEACHIMTVEDPVEFVHKDKKAIVNQRQLDRDTKSFANALKYVLRQDPDVILIGEMRDLETIALAITAAETGHLVIGTLHTTNAIQTVDRIIDVFPHFQQQQVRMQMSVNLVGIISQQLLLRADRKGRVAAYEVLVATNAVRNLVREAKTFQLASVMQTRIEEGMRSMNFSLAELVRRKTVTVEEAVGRSPNPQELAQFLSSGAGAAGRKPAP